MNNERNEFLQDLINNSYIQPEDDKSTDDKLNRLNRKAIEYCLSGKFDCGISKFNEAIANFPEHVFLYYNRAIAKINSSIIDCIISTGIKFPIDESSDVGLADADKLNRLKMFASFFGHIFNKH